MEKILFLVPPNITYDDFVNPPANVKNILKKTGKFGVVITDMPLGVLSLSAYIKKFVSVETKLIDFNVVLNRIDDFDFQSFTEFFSNYLKNGQFLKYVPSMICISTLFSSSYQNMLDVASVCRKVFPSAIIVAGGGVPTNLYREIYKDSGCFDALCYGEGEKPLRELIESPDKIKYLKESKSWITWEKILSGQSFQHDFIENLDEIPFFDYDIQDTEAYRLNPTISAYTSIDTEKKSFPVMTSRGCPHHCSFCAAHTVHGRKVRYYSISRVKEDLKRLKERYDAEIIIFQDDHFLADRQRFFKIIDILKELELTAFFPNSLALYALDREVLEALKSVGVNQLVLSVESGSDRVLRELMHKPLNLSIVKRVADDCRRLKIYSDVNILVGMPGETKQDMEDSVSFLKTVGANWFRINVATPLVGSEMLEVCLKGKYVKDDYFDCNFKKAIVETEDFTAEYVQEKAYAMNLELNFVENSDVRLGDYETALRGFENAIKAKNDHAFAYYYAAKCYNKLGARDKAEQYLDMAKMIVEKNLFWRNYAIKFNVPI